MKRTTMILAAVLLCGSVILAQSNDGPATKKVPTNKARVDIMKTAQSDTNLALFVKHINKANLGSALQGKGPFTVFAPTNAAFNARTPEDINAEHADNAVLISTMKYDILSGKALTGADLMNMNGQMLTMDNGLTLPIHVRGDTIMLGSATLLGSEILATNGVIHVVDKVLIPGKEVPVNAPLPMGR